MKEYDLIIIGAGPGGYEAALDAAKAGMKTALIEKEALGGTCLNHGCIPTKSLLHAANLYKNIQEAGLFGLKAEASVDVTAVQARKNEVVAQLRSGIAAQMKKAKVDVYEGTGRITDAHTVRVGEEDLSARFLMIATGSKTFVPKIPGAELAGVYTSDELLEQDVLCDHLVIIGGGVIGMEFASYYSAMGKQVTVIEAMPRILPAMDKETSQSLKMLLKKKGVDIHTGARVEEIRKGLTVVFTEKETQQTVEADGVLICIGRRPNTEGLFEGEPLVEMERGFIHVNENGQTNVPSIYAIGDVTGGLMLAHEATAEGRRAVEHMQGKTPAIRADIIPGCIYTEPEIASVGLTVDQAKEKGLAADSQKYPMTANGKTVVEGAERGFMKVVFEESTHKILGAQMMCERATDMISEFALAITQDLTLEDMARVVRPHPTFSEAITEAVR